MYLFQKLYELLYDIIWNSLAKPPCQIKHSRIQNYQRAENWYGSLEYHHFFTEHQIKPYLIKEIDITVWCLVQSPRWQASFECLCIFSLVQTFSVIGVIKKKLTVMKVLMFQTVFKEMTSQSRKALFPIAYCVPNIGNKFLLYRIKITLYGLIRLD